MHRSSSTNSRWSYPLSAPNVTRPQLATVPPSAARHDTPPNRRPWSPVCSPPVRSDSPSSDARGSSISLPFHSEYDCGVRWRNSLNRKLRTGHGSEYSWQRPRSEAQKKSKDKLNCSSHLTIHDRPPHAGLAILLLVFACGVHNGDLLFFCFFSAHNPVRELSMGCAQV